MDQTNDAARIRAYRWGGCGRHPVSSMRSKSSGTCIGRACRTYGGVRTYGTERQHWCQADGPLPAEVFVDDDVALRCQFTRTPVQFWRQERREISQRLDLCDTFSGFRILADRDGTTRERPFTVCGN